MKQPNLNQVVKCLFALFIALASGFTPVNAQWNNQGPVNPSLIFNNNTANSRVGIGIQAPKQKLQVSNGNILLDYVSGNALTGNLFFGLPTFNPTSFPSGNPAIDPVSNNGMRLSFTNGTSKSGYLDVRTNSALTDGLIFRVDQNNGGTERMRICANGNIGIGTTAPSQKLYVQNGNLQVNNGTMMVSGSNSFGGPMMLFSDDPANYPSGRWGIEYVPNVGLNFWKPFTSGNNGANYHLLLMDNGMVGMGIDPADVCPNGPFPGGYRLYVKEGILTEKVKVANYCSSFWADYVFAPDYQLKPLAEVESFISEHQHLPGIPSAEEIEKDGLDIADMLSLQMAKIEELTLHTIALNKRLEKVEAENALLKQQLGQK
ncbi:MAG: hypothetical protein SFV22_01780 [Saprospiraceae bacterium]|nr:hypothetical protein [Saprospiraceae bacterium]